MRAERRAARPRVASAQRWLIDLFLIGVAVQFFLAGLGVFGTATRPSRRIADASSFDAHRAFGNVLVAVSLAIFATAIASRRQVRAAALLLVLMVLQAVWTQAGSGTPAVAAVHVLGAFAIAIVAFTMHRTARTNRARPPGH